MNDLKRQPHFMVGVALFVEISKEQNNTPQADSLNKYAKRKK